jgi:ABC-type sugar transport system substrate-binding protein
MSRTIRIGILIGQGEPFWVQVHEALWQRAQTLAVELIEITIKVSDALSSDEQAEVVEDLRVQELDAFICNVYPPALLARILDSGIPIIYSWRDRVAPSTPHLASGPLRRRLYARHIPSQTAGWAWYIAGCRWTYG